MRRGQAVRSAATTATALVLFAGTALGAVRIGTDGADILVGTNGGDFFRPKGGADVLSGLAGNDVYEFESGWGRDAIQDRARYKVDGKRVPGGKDTLTFAKVTNSGIQTALIRQWESNYAITLADDGANRVDLGASVVEKVIGTRASDRIYGGGEANVLDGGGGRGDEFYDYGGWLDGAQGSPGLPVSNDTFIGGAANTGGSMIVQDWGGDADVVDLRPLRLADVFIDRVQSDSDPELEGLHIVTGPDQRVWIPGQFGEYLDRTSAYGQHGQIEKLVFADITIDAREVAEISAGSGGAGGGRNPELEGATVELADQTSPEVPLDLPGIDRRGRNESGERASRPRSSEQGGTDGTIEANIGTRAAVTGPADRRDDGGKRGGDHGAALREGGAEEEHDQDRSPRR